MSETAHNKYDMKGGKRNHRFTLSKQHEMARQLFKDFAENEVKPLAQETDETEAFPQSNG